LFSARYSGNNRNSANETFTHYCFILKQIVKQKNRYTKDINEWDLLPYAIFTCKMAVYAATKETPFFL